jgi:putative ABC transport system permease protein
MKDFPQTSHFHPQFITTPTDQSEFTRGSWVYLLLRQGVNPEQITNSFSKFYASHVSKNPDEQKHAHLEAIADIHLHSNKLREIEPNSSMSVIYTLIIAAALLFLIALFNFVNLNIGMIAFSEKYLVVSRILGAGNHNSVRYFLLENALTGVAAVLISMATVGLANWAIVTQYELHLFDERLILVSIGVIVFLTVVILSGYLSYVRLEAWNSSLRLKNQNKGFRTNASMSLIVVQNIISISLIVAVVVINRQTKYAL